MMNDSTGNGEDNISDSTDNGEYDMKANIKRGNMISKTANGEHNINVFMTVLNMI